MKYVNTTQQVADVLIKGSFSQEHWTQLTEVVGLNDMSNAFLQLHVESTHYWEVIHRPK